MFDGECESDGPVVAAMHVVKTAVLFHLHFQLAVVFKQHAVAVRGRLVFLVDPHHAILTQLVAWHKLDLRFLVARIITPFKGVGQLVELRQQSQSSLYDVCIVEFGEGRVHSVV